MLDLIQIALNNLTDFSDFEKLACEILRAEGHPGITPLGGMNDAGQDAVEKFYFQSGRRIRVVFQITTQETLEGKLRSTLRRLDEAGVAYQQLILVTSRNVTSQRHTELERCGTDQGVIVSVIDQKTLVNRLADLSNGLFHRHFPDIQRQVEGLLGNARAEDIEPRSVVRSALAFTSPHADAARNHVIDELVLSLIQTRRGSAIAVGELVSIHAQLLPGSRPLEHEQIQAAAERLAANGWVEAAPNGYTPTDQGIQRNLAFSLELGTAQRGLAADVADSVERAMGTELDLSTRGLVERNASEALAFVFRLMGLEVSSQLFGRTELRTAQIGSHEEVIRLIGRDLPNAVATVAMAATGDLMSRPNEEQARSLVAYACGYVGASLIEVDPAVRELQMTRMKEKVFVLDTDFLLDCIVIDRPVRLASMGLLEAIVSTGSRVVVPDACLLEAAHHAGRAYRTVNYFGQAMFGLSVSQAAAQIQNVFAAGWYFRNLTTSVDFRSYIDNYYEEKAPAEFMRRVVSANLPDSVEIGNLGQILGVTAAPEMIGKLADEFYRLMTMSRKYLYRTEGDNRSLAMTDAQLYATALSYTEAMGTQTGRALGGSCYLISSSLRFIRAADRVLPQPDVISVRPSGLLGLFQILGRTSVTPASFVALFDNPLMQEAVMRCREDVDTLLDMGLSTSDKSMARLTWDLDSELHERVAEVRTNEARADTTLDARDEGNTAESYLRLVKGAKGRGYRSRSETDAAVDELAASNSDRVELIKKVDELTQRLNDVVGEIAFFGRRRQRYIKRMAQGQIRSPRRRGDKR